MIVLGNDRLARWLIDQRIVEQIRGAWPGVGILLRGDSGFCRDELMNWCEQHRVDYVLGFARNARLRAMLAPLGITRVQLDPRPIAELTSESLPGELLPGPVGAGRPAATVAG